MRIQSSPSASTIPLLLVSIPGLAGAAEGLNLFPDPIHLLVNLVVLSLLILPVSRMLLLPLTRVFEAREARTAGAAARAGELRGCAASLQDQLEARVQSARAEAQLERGRILGQAEQEERTLLDTARAAGQEELARVRDAIGAELEGARRTLQAEARLLAREAASRILGRAL